MIIDYRVPHGTFERLELIAVKVARSVLRGGKIRKDPTYPNRGSGDHLTGSGWDCGYLVGLGWGVGYLGDLEWGSAFHHRRNCGLCHQVGLFGYIGDGVAYPPHQTFSGELADFHHDSRWGVDI
jgi:hypothetical protein